MIYFSINISIFQKWRVECAFSKGQNGLQAEDVVLSLNFMEIL